MNNSAKDSHLWDFGYNVLFFSWNLCLVVKSLVGWYVHVGLFEQVPRLEGYCFSTPLSPAHTRVAGQTCTALAVSSLAKAGV